MKRLLIIRHAWAFEHGDPRWPDDSQRPLETEGAARMERVVAALAERGFAPEILATSPYIRCRQTAEIVAAGVPTRPKIVELAALKPGSDFNDLSAWADRQTEFASIGWVGHAPDVGRLTAMAIGNGEASIRFPKGGVASIRCEVEIASQCGELEWLATAKLLGV